MAISDTKVIDSIGTEELTGDVVLTIIDDLEWVDEHEHLLLLQEKINSYIEFVESGQINVEFPNALITDKVRIDIISKNHYPAIGVDFMKKIQTVLDEVGLNLGYRVFEG